MLTSSPFKPPCPLCRTGIGRAISIGMMGQERTITYLCAECGHKWKATDVVRDWLNGQSGAVKW